MARVSKEAKQNAVDYTREWRHRNADKVKARKLAWHLRHPGRRSFQHWKQMLKKQFNLTPEEYEVMRDEQENRCLICGNYERKISPNGNTHKLAVDHCHKCQEIRGLLCSRCNPLLGFIEEDADLLYKVIDFIKKHGEVCQS